MPAARLPSEFGRYRIERLLGEGGMGSVYLAHDTHLDRQVALKVPHFSEGKGPQIIARFYQEARAAATVHHPHVCPVYDVGEIDGTHYLTMAFVEGKPLESWVEADRALTVRQIATLGRKIADALGEAHKKGVIHRDLKPANVMIDKRGEPVVMDFGLARRATTADDKRLTQAGTILGSPAYMSPEQIRGDTETTGPSTDIFSLGVILYELIARRLPFDGATIAAVQVQILTQPPPPLRDSRPDLDPPLEAICMKALEKKPEDRFRTMGEMAAALKGYLEGKAPGATATPHPAPRPAPPPPPPPQPHSGIHASDFGGRSLVVAEREQVERKQLAKRAEPDRPRRKKKASRSAAPRTGGLVAAGAVALAAVVGLGVVLWPHKKPETVADTPVDLSTAPTTPPPPRGPEPGFAPLFDGKGLTGWTVHGGDPAVWRVENGELGFHVTSPAQRGWLMTDRSYGEFTLRLEFQMSAGANSGVAVRMGPTDPERLTVNIEDNTSPRFAQAPPHERTGGVFGIRLDHKADLRPLGEWNAMEVTLLGNSLLAMVNGKETTRVELDDPAVVNYLGHKPDETGRIALNAAGESVRFRNIEIKEFPSAARPVAKAEPPGQPVAASIFNGKDLTGWKNVGDPPRPWWRVKDGELVAASDQKVDPKSKTIAWDTIRTEKEYSDYRLAFEFQAGPESLAYVMTKWKHGYYASEVSVKDDSFEPDWGRENQVNVRSYTGDFAPYYRGHPAVMKPVGQWNKMEVVVRWPNVEVLVNDRHTFNSPLLPSFPKYVEKLVAAKAIVPTAPIGFRSVYGTVRFRNIKIEEFPSASRPAPKAEPPAPKAEPPAPKVEPPAPKSPALFNGKDLAGWKNEGNQLRTTWQVKDGELVAANNQQFNPKAKVNFRDELRTEKEFSDYRLALEFQADKGSLAYVAPRWKQFEFAFLVPIADDGFAPFQQLLGPTKGTGGLKPFLIHRRADLKPAGEWNKMEIAMKWPNVTILVNDKKTFDSSQLPNFLALISKVRNVQEFPKSGPIGLISSYGTVRFRKIELVPIADH